MLKMKKIKVTKRVTRISYAIRDVIAQAKQLEKQGLEILYLNIGDPLKFDFDTPRHIKQALADAVNSGVNWYAPSEGLPELREAICEKENRVNGINLTPENVVVTSGVSEGIQMVTAAIVEEGSEVLVPGPSYPPYTSFTEFFGGTPVPYRTIEQENWKPDIDDLRAKVTDKTRAILIINPNNPTGALYDEKTVGKIVDVAAEHDLPILSDEMYDQIVFGKKFVSTARIAKDVPVVGLNGFSKAYLMTGWRLGYVYFHDSNEELSELRDCVQKETRIRLSANAPVQKAGVEALRGSQDHIKPMVKRLHERAEYSWKRLNEIRNVSCAKPEGAFYVFPKFHTANSRWKNDAEMVFDILKNTGILIVHGSGFCRAYGTGHARAVVLPSLDTLTKAWDRLEAFMKKQS